jgi:hypothetical protein
MPPHRAFRDYVREVFAKHSVPWRLRRSTSQAHPPRRFVQRPMPRAEQRWEGEGGSTR